MTVPRATRGRHRHAGPVRPRHQPTSATRSGSGAGAVRAVPLLVPFVVAGLVGMAFGAAFLDDVAVPSLLGVVVVLVVAVLLDARWWEWLPRRTHERAPDLDVGRVAPDPARVGAVVQAGERLDMVFQPVLDLRVGSIVGYEALARFPSGRPDEWFAEAHRVGLGVDLEMSAVLRAVSQRAADWGYVSINVSPMTILSQGFIDVVSQMEEPHRLVVELTEHADVEDYELLSTVLWRLRRRGIRIAVDDAGSGISSFRHILTIAPEIVKLDRSLIAGLDKDDARRALGEALVQFATRIGAQLIAEGIERPEERVACIDLGIRYGQGYLLGAPAPRPPSSS